MGPSRRARALVAICVAGASIVVTHLACTSFNGGHPEADAATQADAASEVDGAHFCAAHADSAVCADFDEGDPVNFHFTQLFGNVTLGDASAASPPFSMKVVSTDGTASLLSAQATPAMFLTEQHFSFATYPGMLQPAPTSYIAGIQQGADCSFDIESFADHARLVVTTPGDGGSKVYKPFPMTAYPPAGRWSRVDILLEASGNKVTATVKVDTIVAVRTSTPCTKLAPEPFMYVGFIGAIGDARYDDVLFEGY